MPRPTVRSILQLCAHDAATEARREALLDLLSNEVGSASLWTALVRDAEREGIAPLVHEHLGRVFALPENVRLSLMGLAARHRLMAKRLEQAISEISGALDEASLPHLFLKGAAAAYSAYARPDLRAMRDIDLLVRPSDAGRVLSVLQAFGWREKAPFAIRYRHESGVLVKEHGPLLVELDLHHRLGIRDLPSHRLLPRQTLDELMADSMQVAVGTSRIRVPSREDQLRFVYRHGYCLPIDEDDHRYVSLADIVTMVERWGATLDYARLDAIDPHVRPAIAMLGWVSPWSADAARCLGFSSQGRPRGVGLHYYGWLRTNPGERPSLRCTFFPSEWWLLLRHGGGPRGPGTVRAWSRHIGELSVRAWGAALGRPRPER